MWLLGYGGDKMAADEEIPGNYRPYAPPSNVTAVLSRLRSRNMPERIDNEYLRAAGVPEGSVARTMTALNFLGLVKDNAPTGALRTIATSTDEEYRETLAGLIREAYRDVFDVVDPGQDSQDRIVNVFKRYVPASQRERMVVFYLGMCREAGIPTMDIPRQRSSSVSGGARATRSATRGASRQAAPSARSGPLRSGPLRSMPEDGAADIGGVHPSLLMLVRSLPAFGTPLPEQKRKQWLNMAEATLAFMFPEYGEGGNLVEEVQVAE